MLVSLWRGPIAFPRFPKSSVTPSSKEPVAERGQTWGVGKGEREVQGGRETRHPEGMRQACHCQTRPCPEEL